MWPASPELPNFFMFHKTPFRNYVPTKIGLWVVAMFVIQRLRIEKLWNNLKLRDSLLPNLKCMGYNVGILSPWRPPCIKYPLPWASLWGQAGKPRDIWMEGSKAGGRKLPWASSWCQAGKPRDIWKEAWQGTGNETERPQDSKETELRRTWKEKIETTLHGKRWKWNISSRMSG